MFTKLALVSLASLTLVLSPLSVDARGTAGATGGSTFTWMPDLIVDHAYYYRWGSKWILHVRVKNIGRGSAPFFYTRCDRSANNHQTFWKGCNGLTPGQVKWISFTVPDRYQAWTLTVDGNYRVREVYESNNTRYMP